MDTPLKNHWLPLEAEEVRVLPFCVITGLGGAGRAVMPCWGDIKEVHPSCVVVTEYMPI
jgi:hypothetical protein